MLPTQRLQLQSPVDLYDSKGITGGETGIRTLDRVSPIHAFQACAFNRSAISPGLTCRDLQEEPPGGPRDCPRPPAQSSLTCGGSEAARLASHLAGPRMSVCYARTICDR